jgi:hypothetical protein
LLLRLGFTPTASNATGTRIDGTAACFITHPVSSVIITRREVKKSVIYTPRQQRFVAGKVEN